MPWHAVEVVTPPAIEQFRITLTPPEYSGRPPEELAGDAGHVAALVGTHVRVEALTNVPLSSATFRRDGQAQEPVRLGAEGTEFGVEFDVAASGRSSYWFDLVDRHGLRNATPARYEVRGIEDREPVVALEQPATDVTATPTATLPLVISAQDDLGLRQMRLVLADPPSSAGEQVRPLAAPPDGARQVRVEAPLDIGELGLSPGRQLVVRAEATDGFDLAGEHVGKSVSRSVRIVTAEEKLRELHARHAGIAASLERSLVLQSHALQSVRELRIQFAAAGALQPQDMDVLKRVEQDQLRIGGELHDDRRGAERRVREVLDELEWNGIVDAPTQDRLQRLADGLSELRLEVLPRIEQVVTQTRKVAVAGGNASGELAGRLTQTELLQSASVDALAALHDLLAQWRQQFDLQRHVGELLAGQTQLNADTVSVGRRTLTKSQLAPQDQADLARLSDRQNRLAADVERFQKRLQQMSSDPAGSSSAHDGAVLEQAAALLRDSAVVDEMKLVGQQLPRNNIGESLKTQQGILQTLTQLDEALRGMGIPDAETLLRQIVQAEEQLETLHKGQQEAMEQARELAATGMAEGAAVEELRKKQAELADQTNASALQLRRQQLSGPASSAARASRQMREAADRLQQDASGEALDRQQEALDDLQQAQRELAEARRDMELRRALEQFAQLAAMLDALTDRQEQLTNDTARLDEVHSREGRFSRTQLKSLQELAEAQARLQQDTEQLIETVLDTEVFRAALESAGAEMKRAAERLRERLVDEPTQRAQRAAWSGLEDLRQVLAETRPQGGDAPRPGPSAGEDHRTPGWSLVTQVRLLKRMQEYVARRTAVLTAILSDGGTLTAEQQAERERLAAQQARIAGIAAQTLVEMAAPASAPPTGEEPSP
jgi:uncharacterized protein YoaH (UPF0181 family)